jgi:hypothetical protein
MKLYLVSGQYMMPVGANSKEEAVRLVKDLVNTVNGPGETHDVVSIGLDSMSYTAIKVNELNEIPGDWQESNLYNTEDLDCLYAHKLLTSQKNKTKLQQKISEVEDLAKELGITIYISVDEVDE